MQTLTVIHKNGDLVAELDWRESQAIIDWWKGEAVHKDKKMLVDQILVRLHKQQHWLRCACQDHTNQPAFLFPVKKDAKIFLKRSSQDKAHHLTCVFWNEQAVDEADQEKLNTSSNDFKPKPPKFGVDAEDLHAANTHKTAVSSTPDPNAHRGARLSKNASRLFWLAHAAGLQAAPRVAPIPAILDIAKTVPIKQGLMLNSTMFCTAKARVENWFNNAYKKCESVGTEPLAWWIQEIKDINLDTRTVYFEDVSLAPMVVDKSAVLKVHAGNTDQSRFPMLLIAAVTGSDEAHFRVSEAYAHPIFQHNFWMLVDSNLERQTMRSLVQVCQWLQNYKKINVQIHKPLYNWKQTKERPDFVLTLENDADTDNYFVVETMGYDDPEYNQRKIDLAEKMAGEVFYDRRLFGNLEDKSLKSAISKWAIRTYNNLATKGNKHPD